jgi:hypothetical protein
MATAITHLLVTALIGSIILVAASGFAGILRRFR